ncbi:MAG: putative zinc-binding dehydrogenase [Frondihabitans sp.]|nr:putative zinc-binding dehydrogenase [Frondihabitans sp.]
MKAAVVTSFDSAPRFDEFRDPSVTEDDEMVVDVVAAGLHPRVRSQADGSHYTSTDELPLIPGVDGVGRDENGTLRYFVLADTTLGSMAEKTIIDRRRSVVLPEGSDPITVAAAMNPAMSSWIALRQRIRFEPGQNVLVLGATGNAGQMAIQVAKLLGASEIIGAARNADLLAGLPVLGATATVHLDGDPDEVAARLGAAAKHVDVVIDYLWGEPTEQALVAVVLGREDEHQPLTWIQIGSVTGATARIPSAALRSTRLSIVGSGQGSVSAREIVAELPALAAEITKGTFEVDARAVPLADVEQAWSDAATSKQRIVLTPGA